MNPISTNHKIALHSKLQSRADTTWKSGAIFVKDFLDFLFEFYFKIGYKN